MRTRYDSLDIQFTSAGVKFRILSLIYERFRRTIQLHSHGAHCYELHYIDHGYGTAQINGTTYEITPNTLYITGPHIPHAQAPLFDDPMWEYCVYFTAEQKSTGKPGAFVQAVLGTPFWFGQDSQNVKETMARIFSELENRKTGYMVQVEALLQQLMVQLARNYEQERKDVGQFESANLTDSKSIIMEEYFLYEYKNLSLEQLARRLGVTPRQTERLLKQYYGKTFLQKKAEARMSAASTLLGDPTRSITDISEALGYSSIEHFSNAFRRYYGMNARDYRKAQKKNP